MYLDAHLPELFEEQPMLPPELLEEQSMLSLDPRTYRVHYRYEIKAEKSQIENSEDKTKED